MFEIVAKKALHKTVTQMEIVAPLVAKKAKAGQFVILRVAKDGERIPLTVASYDREKGTITVIFQVVGATTEKLNRKKVGEFIPDFVGPLGKPTETSHAKKVCIVGGGVGTAIALPVARAFQEEGAHVTSIIGFRSRELVILEDEFKKYSNVMILVTDDGSYGERGNVCAPLERLLSAGERFDEVITIGPLVMMKYVCETTKKYAVKTVASMNPIMIDGTGMCGGCRLTVDGKMQFACVDGPEFDGHLIDFDDAISRSSAYRDFERRAHEKACHLFQKEAGDEQV